MFTPSSVHRRIRLFRGIVTSAAIAAFFWLAATTHGQPAEFRAFWVDAWRDGYKSPQEISKLVADVRAANCNAILFQVRRRADALYRSSPFESFALTNELTKIKGVKSDFDPLADLLQKAHDTNAGPRIEVHAWFVTYPAAYKIYDLTGKKVHTATFDPRNPLNHHPDWEGRTPKGYTFDGRNYTLDPGHPAAQKYLFDVAMDIIERYNIDGFHFDYIHYPSEDWGYNPVSVSRFNKLFGRSGEPTQKDPQWLQFRRDQVTALLRKIYLSAIAIKPRVKISASTVAWPPAPASDQQWLSRSAAYNNKLQDWRAWMEEGILDMNIPMVFYRQAVPTYVADFKTWRDFTIDHRYNRHVVIGTGNFLSSVPDSIVQMRLAREKTASGKQADGVCIYSYSTPAAGESVPRDQFISSLAIQGAAESGQGPIFSSPVPTPKMPWKESPTKGHLKGYISTGNERHVVDGAKLSLSGPINKDFVSDGTGFFGAVDLPPGKYTLKASSPGVADVTQPVEITAGKVSSLDVKVSKK